jgi:hypothetical protein
VTQPCDPGVEPSGTAKAHVSLSMHAWLTCAVTCLRVCLAPAGFKGIPDWQPLLDNPPFPEYPSGHQCAAGAALAVIQKTLGTDKVRALQTVCVGTGPKLYDRAGGRFRACHSMEERYC